MAISRGQQGTSVAEDLFQNSYCYEFHQAVKVLQLLYPKHEKLGHGIAANEEVVTIKTNVTFSAPPSDIYALVKPSAASTNTILSVNFMSLAGHSGPLPDAYTELILERIHSHDRAFADFLDIFTHRLVSLSHRIRVKYNFCLEMAPPHQIPAANVLESLGGINAFVEETELIPKRCFLKYAGHFWQQPHSVTALKLMLWDYFQLPIQIEECVGQWLYLDSSQVTRIGNHEQMNRLGDTASLGDKAWSCAEKLRISVGPLPLKTYTNFFPGGILNKKFAAFIRSYLGNDHQFDFTIQLKQRDIPKTKLDGTARLGWTSWLRHGKESTDAAWVTVEADDPRYVI